MAVRIATFCGQNVEQLRNNMFIKWSNLMENVEMDKWKQIKC